MAEKKGALTKETKGEPIRMIKVSNLPDGAVEETLINYFENGQQNGFGPIESVEYHPETSSAIVKFQRADALMKDTKGEPIKMIKVTNLPDGAVEETLINYFENLRRKGVGPIGSVDYHPEKSSAIIKFQEADGAKHGNILTRCLLKLLHDMNVDLVLDVITAKELIHDLTLRSIREQQITSDKIRKLVRLIDQRNEYVYKEFKDCLRQTGQSDLAKFLEEEEMKSTARRNPSQDQLKESSHKMIQHYYREMKMKLDIDIVMDHLIQDEVLDWNDRDEIMQYRLNLRVERLLQKLLLSKSQLTFECFLSALRQTHQTDLAEKLEMQEECLTDKKVSLGVTMETFYEQWSKIEEYLLEELVPESIMDFFMEMAMFGLDDYTFIFPGTYGRKKRTEEFLKRIKVKLPESFDVLHYALTETVQTNIVEELEKIINGTTADGRKHKEKHKRCPDITVVRTDENECTIDGSVRKFKCINLELKITSDEKPASQAENIINIMINDTQKIDSLKINFISSTGCGIVKSEKGSVIIYLQPLSRCSYERLQNFCRSGGLKEFILNILKEEEIIDSLPQGEICIDVQVVCKKEKSVFEDLDESKGMTAESICHTEIKESLETIKENIIVHFEAIVDEIDPIFLEQLFIDRGILSKQFFMNLKETCKKRKTRAAVFLKEVLVKGGETLIALIDALKETGCSNLLDMVNSDDKQLHPRQFQSTGSGLFNKEVLSETNVHSKAGLMWSCSLKINVDKHVTSKYISRPDTGVMKPDAQLYMSTKKYITDIPMDTTEVSQKISDTDASLEVQFYQIPCVLGAASKTFTSAVYSAADDDDLYNPERFSQKKKLDQIVPEFKTNQIHDEEMNVLYGDHTDISESYDYFLYQSPAPQGQQASVNKSNFTGDHEYSDFEEKYSDYLRASDNPEFSSDYQRGCDFVEDSSGAEWNQRAVQLSSTKNITVKSLLGRITECKVQAIAITQNTKLSSSSGLAKYIFNTAGKSVWQDLQRQTGGDAQEPGTVMTTASGALREIKHIIHIVTPSWGYYKDRTGKMQCLYILESALYTCFKRCIDKSWTSVAIAAIGSGNCGVSAKLCCLVYASALLKIDDYCRLKQITNFQIYFVDISEPIITYLSKYFNHAFRSGYESLANQISNEVEKDFAITSRNIREGLQVKVYKGDISVFREGSVLCSVTKHLNPVGQDTERIIHKAGDTYTRKLDVLRRARKYKGGHVAETVAGNISAHLVFHCIIPSKKKNPIHRKRHYQEKLTACYTNAFRIAREQGKAVVALSVLGFDCDYLDNDLCCSALEDALCKESLNEGTSLKQIHVVCSEDDMLARITTLIKKIQTQME